MSTESMTYEEREALWEDAALLLHDVREDDETVTKCSKYVVLYDVGYWVTVELADDEVLG